MTIPTDTLTSQAKVDNPSRRLLCQVDSGLCQVDKANYYTQVGQIGTTEKALLNTHITCVLFLEFFGLVLCCF